MRYQETERLDEELKCLAIAAQRHPPLSKKRKQALTKLVHAILRSGELWRIRKNKSQFYQDVHADAVQELMLYICENIEEYDPERGSFMEWAVMLLSKRFINKVISRARDKRIKEFPTKIALDTFLGNVISHEDSPSLSEELMTCIDLDPEGIFKCQHLRNNENVNFQILMKRRLSGETWKQISEDLEIEATTLSSFYQRCLEKFIDKFKKYLTE